MTDQRLRHLITPEELAKNGTEHGAQSALMQWVALEGIHEIPDLDLLFAIPNGGDRRPSEGAKMRAEGVRPGVPDLCWAVPCPPVHGLYIEMKRPALRPKNPPPAFTPVDSAINDGRSAAQKTVGRRLQEVGYAVAIAYSWQEAIDVIRLYHAWRTGTLTLR